MAINTNFTIQQAANVALVDLSEQPAKAKVVRQGYDVPLVRFDARRVDQFVGELIAVPPRELPRVVSQTIPPGTKVSAGTVVDLVLAPRTKIPFSVLEGVHADLSTRTLDAVDPLFDNAAAKKTLLTYERAEDVPAAERAALITALQGVDVTVNDADQNRSFGKAFEAARGAMAFQG